MEGRLGPGVGLFCRKITDGGELMQPVCRVLRKGLIIHYKKL